MSSRKSVSPAPSKTSKPRTRSDGSAKAEKDGKGKTPAAAKRAKRKPSTKVATTKQGAAAALLTPAQHRFVSEYLKDQNATAAYKRAGYKGQGHVAESAAARLLSHVEVRASINAGLDDIRKRAEDATAITLERTLREIGKVAFHDPRKMFNEDGSPKKITELSDAEAASLTGFEILEQFEGSGNDRVFIGNIKKIKTSERKGYLDMLMKHFGGYEIDNSQKSRGLVDVLAEFAAGIHSRNTGRLPIVPPKRKDGQS